MTTQLKDVVETFLLGNGGRPSNLVDEALIGRSLRGVVDIDITKHMNNEGRFVTASQFDLVENFFDANFDVGSLFSSTSHGLPEPFFSLDLPTPPCHWPASQWSAPFLGLLDLPLGVT